MNARERGVIKKDYGRNLVLPFTQRIITTVGIPPTRLKFSISWVVQ